MASQELDIRLATPDDLALVSDIYSSACLWLHNVKGITDLWSREVSAEEMQELVGSNQLYLAFVSNEAAGAFKLTEQDRLWEAQDGAIYVHAFAVHRKFEGMGIGKKMLDWAGDLARKKGKQYLRLDCMDQDPGLKQYYAKAGFELLGTHPQNTWSALFQKEVGVPDYIWRAARREDVPALYEMLMAADRVDNRGFHTTLQDLQTQFDDPWCNPETDFQIALAQGGQIAAMARVLANPESNQEECRAYLLDEAHPEHRGRGLEEFTLSWMEQRGRERLQEIDHGLPRILRVNIPDHLHDRIALLKHHGFQPVRFNSRMRRDLKQPIPEKRLPEGLTLRRYSPELDRPMLDTFNASFQDHWGFEPATEQDWQMFFVQSSDFCPDLTAVAMEGDRVAGLCLSMIHAETNKRRGIKEGWINELGVLREWRKRGVASALLCQAMQAFKAEGLDYAALGVDTENPTGALRLYEQLGFVAFRRFITFSKPVE